MVVILWGWEFVKYVINCLVFGVLLNMVKIFFVIRMGKLYFFLMGGKGKILIWLLFIFVGKKVVMKFFWWCR